MRSAANSSRDARFISASDRRSERIRDSFITAVLACGHIVACRPSHAPEIIDRILAVVDGAIIMQSDVTMAMRLALVPPSPRI